MFGIGMQPGDINTCHSFLLIVVQVEHFIYVVYCFVKILNSVLLTAKKDIGTLPNVDWEIKVPSNERIFKIFGNFKLPKIFGGLPFIIF